MREARLREYRAQARLPQSGDHLGEPPRQHRRNTLERLIEKKQARARHHGARERHQLLLPA